MTTMKSSIQGLKKSQGNKRNKLWKAKKIRNRKINLRLRQMNVRCVDLIAQLIPS
jgi:hypothetical protein